MTSLIANGLWHNLVFFDAGKHLCDFQNTCTTNNTLCHRGCRQCQNLMSYFVRIKDPFLILLSYFFSQRNTISAASVRGAFLVSFANVLLLLFFFFFFFFFLFIYFFFFAVFCFVLMFVCLFYASEYKFQTQYNYQPFEIWGQFDDF